MKKKDRTREVGLLFIVLRRGALNDANDLVCSSSAMSSCDSAAICCNHSIGGRPIKLGEDENSLSDSTSFGYS